MTKYPKLSQLGRPATLPPSPDKAVLETVPNPQPKALYLVRFTAPDDVPLSTASGRASAYIAIHVFQKMEYDRYFRGVEAIMDDYDGRPHWGKLHFQNAESLRPRYPQWDRFLAVRDRIDADGRFTNDYLRTVLGR